MQSISRTAIVTALTLGLVAVVSGCRHRGGHDPEKARKHATYVVNDFLDDLEATPAQRTATLAAKDRLLDRALSLHAESPKVARALAVEWDKARPSAEALHALVEERAALMTSFAHAAVDELVALHAMLTPAQREQVSARIAERLEDR